MTDLEITKLCAEAMGIAIREVSQNKPEATLRIGGVNYWPLKNDVQVMAMVKKFNINLTCPFFEKSAYPVSWHAAMFVPMYEPQSQYFSINYDLNRAICECVANMQKEKP